MDALNVRDKHLPQVSQRRFSMAETHPLVPVPDHSLKPPEWRRCADTVEKVAG
jgi:hypothetical protein